PPSEIPQLIGVMDALVHLSRREGLARAPPPALAPRKTVVGYDCDGAGGGCIVGEAGVLVRTGGWRALTGRLLQPPPHPALRLRLGKQGRVFVEQRFSVETMIEQLETLYWRLAHRQGSTAEAGDAAARP